MKIKKTSFKKTFSYLVVFMVGLITISAITTQLGIESLEEGSEFAKALITPNTNLVLLIIAIGIMEIQFLKKLYLEGFYLNI